MKKLFLIALLTAPLSVLAQDDDEALFTLSVMKPEMALALAQAALDSCRAQGYQIAVAVVDRFGIVQVLLRDRFAGSHTPDTAIRKAWTAVSFRTATEELSQSARPDGFIFGANFISNALMLGGGVPVEAHGSLVGGIGISGAPGGDIDDACARDGIAAVEADLNF